MNATTTGSVARREATLRQLELRITRTLDGLLQGDHRGLVAGGGTEPGDGRPYEPGDDVRRIDWSLTARSGAPHVRQTVADRELETWLVVDRSASLDFGTADCEKRDLALAAAAAFGLLAARDGNRVGALLFGAGPPAVVPPRTGRAWLLALLHRIERGGGRGDGGGRQSLDDALRRVALAARRRGLVVVISDLLDDTDWPGALRGLASRHDVVVVEPRDPREAAIPDVGLLTLVDPETGRRVEVQTADARLRARFAAAAERQNAETSRAVKAAGAAHLVLSTDRDWMLDVVRFVAARKRRR